MAAAAAASTNPLVSSWPMNSTDNLYMLDNVSIHTSFKNEQEEVFADADEGDDFDVTIIERKGGSGKICA